MQKLFWARSLKHFYFEDAFIATHKHEFIKDPQFKEACGKGLGVRRVSDFLLIDGDRVLAGARSYCEMYSPLVKINNTTILHNMGHIVLNLIARWMNSGTSSSKALSFKDSSKTLKRVCAVSV